MTFFPSHGSQVGRARPLCSLIRQLSLAFPAGLQRFLASAAHRFFAPAAIAARPAADMLGQTIVDGAKENPRDPKCVKFHRQNHDQVVGKSKIKRDNSKQSCIMGN